jgi:hypothetical protein
MAANPGRPPAACQAPTHDRSALRGAESPLQGSSVPLTGESATTSPVLAGVLKLCLAHARRLRPHPSTAATARLSASENDSLNVKTRSVFPVVTEKRLVSWRPRAPVRGLALEGLSPALTADLLEASRHERRGDDEVAVTGQRHSRPVGLVRANPSDPHRLGCDPDHRGSEPLVDTQPRVGQQAVLVGRRSAQRRGSRARGCRPARGSLTARSRRPCSISVSEGGQRSRRVARHA